jgi:hypothetical protein
MMGGAASLSLLLLLLLGTAAAGACLCTYGWEQTLRGYKSGHM